MALTFVVVILFCAVIIGALASRRAIPSGSEPIGHGYYRNGSNIYKEYQSREGFSQSDYRVYEIKKADANTFVPLSYSYAKDKNHAYYFERPFDAELSSFENVDDRYAKDSNHVYYRGDVLKQANPGSFMIVSHGNRTSGFFYAKDDVRVFYEDTEIEFADPQTFEVLSGFTLRYSRDKNHVWYDGKLMKDADPTTFQVLFGDDSKYSRDKDGIYVFGKVTDFDIATFGVVAGQNQGKSDFVKDKNGVYCHEYGKDASLRIEGANPETFALLSESYAKDDAHVFRVNCLYSGFFSEILNGVDPETFEVK